MRKLALGMFLLLPVGLAAADHKPEKALGTNTAPIILELYSDFQCPACKALYEGTLQMVIREYVNAGKVYLIHRDFPLTMHQYSREAAQYANAAIPFGKYEQVSAALYRRQEYWGANGKVDEVVASVLTPEEMKKARVALKDPQLNSAIDQDIALGYRVGIKQTPTMIFTHRLRVYPVSGNVSYAILKRFLDDLLSK